MDLDEKVHKRTESLLSEIDATLSAHGFSDDNSAAARVERVLRAGTASHCFTGRIPDHIIAEALEMWTPDIPSDDEWDGEVPYCDVNPRNFMMDVAKAADIAGDRLDTSARCTRGFHLDEGSTEWREGRCRCGGFSTPRIEPIGWDQAPYQEGPNIAFAGCNNRDCACHGLFDVRPDDVEDYELSDEPQPFDYGRDFSDPLGNIDMVFFHEDGEKEFILNDGSVKKNRMGVKRGLE